MSTKAMLRIRPIHEVADKLSALVAPHVACKRGCSHCCHIRVAISDAEAHYIGQKIGVKPVAASQAAKKMKDMKAYSYETPCTFLENGECSIYENRPTVCRTHASFDIDAETCNLIDDNGKTRHGQVPVPELLGINDALNTVIRLVANTPMADIRDFFPNGRKA